MSNEAGQSWSGAAAAVAVERPHGSPGAVATLEIQPAAPTRESVYHGVGLGQRVDLFALANKHGLLYWPALPGPSPRCLSLAEGTHTWNQLGKVLAGQVSALVPVSISPIDVIDTALDE